jgi:hypothetical protein
VRIHQNTSEYLGENTINGIWEEKPLIPVVRASSKD